MTEVRDANDLAPSDGGSSSAGADGFHYSVRSNANHGSQHSHRTSNHSGSPRHHHQQQQEQQQQHRRQNHHRPYNLSQDQAPACLVPASPSPEMTKSKSRGFKLWRSREQGEVLIELAPLKKTTKKKKSGSTRGEDVEGVAPGTGGSSLHNDLPADEEKQRFIGEEDGELETEENEEAEAGTKLLSKPEGSNPPRDRASNVPILRHKHYSASCGGQTSVPKGGADTLPNGVSPAVKEDDHPAERGGKPSNLKGGEYPPVKDGGGEWGVLAMNGGSRHILKDSRKDWSGRKTVDFLLKDKHNSTDVVQSQNAKNSNHGLTNQHGALAHVGYAQTAHCVQL